MATATKTAPAAKTSTAKKAAPTKAAATAKPKAASSAKPEADAPKPEAPAAAKPKAAATKTKTADKPATSKSASAKPAASKRASAPRSPKVTDAQAKNARSANRQSRDSSMTSKEHDDHAERAWSLADRIGIAMFVTWDGERQRARPLAATVKKDEGAIYFLTDVAGEKDDQISEFPYVSVNFSDNRKARYVVFSGKATLSNDRELIKEFWSPFAKAWWDSPEDPNIRLIKMSPEDAELWDSPGRLVSTVSMLTAAVTGKAPKLGENAKIVLH